MDELKWFGVTRSPEEDLALATGHHDHRILTVSRFLIFLALSAGILAVYVFSAGRLHPAYPVVSPAVEDNAVFNAAYPPFRLDEATMWDAARAVAAGRIATIKLPPGYPLAAALFVRTWGEYGLFMTNVFILWIAALLFFFVMLETAGFSLATVATAGLAFATPNFFYSSSAFPEPMAQMLLLASVFCLIRGMHSSHERGYFLMCGFMAGLNIFVVPWTALAGFILLGVVLVDRGVWVWKERSFIWLVTGFAFPLIAAFGLDAGLGGGWLSGWIGSSFFGVYVRAREAGCLCDTTIITGMWEVLFGGRHGLVYLMPVTMLFIPGIMRIWRDESRLIAHICGLMVLAGALAASVVGFFVVGDGIGARNLVPVVPFILIPAAVLWRTELGERSWLIALSVLTLYMCAFGWWTGPGWHGYMSGQLHDRDARAVILARTQKLPAPHMRSSADLVGRSETAVITGDFATWLGTLDTETLASIRGREREIFDRFRTMGAAGSSQRASLIVSTDPDNGIRLAFTDSLSVQ